MSKIEVAAIMCDDEYGCDDVEVTFSKYADFPKHWGIETRDPSTQHLCWDCVHYANEDDDHYLRTGGEGA